jgi:hypothetical protein
MEIARESGIEKETKWRGHLERANARTGSLEKFCRDEGLSLATLNYWRKKLNEDSGTSMPAVITRARPKAPQFIPVQLTESTRDSKRAQLPDPAWLAELILHLTSKGALR